VSGADGRPWISPVWFARAPAGELLWISSPEARHSENIAVRPDIAIVIFDSTVAIGAAEALYLEAVAGQVPVDRLLEATGASSTRSLACGGRARTIEDLTGDAPFRLYEARATAQSVLGPGDRRLPLAPTR
jgi:hypothetical protein